MFQRPIYIPPKQCSEDEMGGAISGNEVHAQCGLEVPLWKRLTDPKLIPRRLK